MLKLIIRFDEALIEAKPKRDVPNKANKAIFNANSCRSVPNNGQVKEAKVSSCTQDTNKALNGKVKRGTNKRANDDKKSEVRQAK